MAVEAISRRSAAARSRPILATSSCASSRVSVNPACVARTPEGANRRQQRHRDDRSPDAKRRRRDDDARRVSYADRKRKRDSDSSVRASRGDHDSRKGSSSSRDSCTRMSRHARRPSKNLDDERAHKTRRRRSRSRSSPPSEPKTQPPVLCAEQAQPQLPAATVATPPRIVALDDNYQPLQDLTEQFEEAEWRRRETQRKREESRREMDKVVQTVYFDDPFVSLMEILKR